MKESFAITRTDKEKEDDIQGYLRIEWNLRVIWTEDVSKCCKFYDMESAELMRRHLVRRNEIPDTTEITALIHIK